MSTMSLPQLVTDHDDQGIPHIPWCTEHVNYDADRSPLDGSCTVPIDLAFGPIAPGHEDVNAARVSLWACVKEQDREISTDVVFVGFNGSGCDETGIAPWKCVPLAFALLSANARALGDEESAESFARLAQSAIEQHAGDRIRDRMEVVDRARYSAAYREGMLEAYREAGRPDMVPALLQDMDWLDRFSPDEPPSMHRTSTMPSTRTAPDGTFLDLTRPMLDRDGRAWHWAGYSKTGHPVVSRQPDGDVVTPIGAAYNATGPFTQDSGRAPAPQFVVQSTAEAGHWQVGGVDPRYNGKSVDGHDYTDFEAAKRAATVLNAAKAVFDSAPVGHHLDRTQPHPRAIKDCAHNVYGIDATDEEIRAAVQVVMS